MKLCRYCSSPVPGGACTCPNCGASEFDFRCARCGTVFSAPCCPQCALPSDAEGQNCPQCGTRFFSSACPQCGFTRIQSRYTQTEPAQWGIHTPVSDAVSGKSRTAALILAVVLGIYGAHRFYVGKVGSGILYLCTAGFFGIGWLVDVIMIATGTFTDKYGLRVADW